MSIYKYLSSERILVLKNATLRATQANALNDPFELKPIFDEFLVEHDLKNILDQHSIFEEELKNAYLALPITVRRKVAFKTFQIQADHVGLKKQFESKLAQLIGSMNSTVPSITDRVKNLLYEKLGNLVGIISFSDDPSEVLMWTHYASNHQGFVIEFDDKHPFFDRRRSGADEFFHLRPVSYEPIPSDLVKFSDLDGEKALCTKHSKWSYEREKRLLIPLDPSSFKGIGEAIHLIDFPRSAVTGIIAGDRSSPELITDLRVVLREQPDYQHVQFYKAKTNVRTGDMLIENLF